MSSRGKRSGGREGQGRNSQRSSSDDPPPASPPAEEVGEDDAKAPSSMVGKGKGSSRQRGRLRRQATEAMDIEEDVGKYYGSFHDLSINNRSLLFLFHYFS